jgi:hypothetical protein
MDDVVVWTRARLVVLRTLLLLFLIPEALLTLSASAARSPHSHAPGSEMDGWAAASLALNPDVWAFALATFLLWGPLRNGPAAVAHARQAAALPTWVASLWPPTAALAGQFCAAVAVWRVLSLATVCALLPSPSNDGGGEHVSASAMPTTPRGAVLLHPIVAIRDSCHPALGPAFPVVSASPAHSLLVAAVDAAVVVVLAAMAHQLAAIATPRVRSP